MADSLLNPGPQPNFPRMAQLQRIVAQSQHGFAEECERLSNLPQITSVNIILEAIQRLGQDLGGRIDTVRQELGGRIDAVHQELGGRIDTVHQRIDAVQQVLGGQIEELGERVNQFGEQQRIRDENHSARIRNSLIRIPDDLLSPLINPITGNQIRNFPERPRMIEDMTVAELDLVLGQLGIRAQGNKVEKQRSLRVQIGLKAEPNA